MSLWCPQSETFEVWLQSLNRSSEPTHSILSNRIGPLPPYAYGKYEEFPVYKNMAWLQVYVSKHGMTMWANIEPCEKHTRIAQLSADYISICLVPVVTTYCAPVAINTDHHTTFIRSTKWIYETYVTFFWAKAFTANCNVIVVITDGSFIVMQTVNQSQLLSSAVSPMHPNWASSRMEVAEREVILCWWCGRFSCDVKLWRG